jgi:nucleoside-diphosphate-sugar epimerase
MGSGSDRVADAPAITAGAVVVTGAASDLGRRVCALAAADPEVTHVIAIDRRSLKRLPAGIERHQIDLATAELKPLFEGATTVVHLAQADGPARGETIAEPTGEGAMARRVLDAASAVGASHIVLLSSATAYGACAAAPQPGRGHGVGEGRGGAGGGRVARRPPGRHGRDPPPHGHGGRRGERLARAGPGPLHRPTGHR